jgi:hypothetical protein
VTILAGRVGAFVTAVALAACVTACGDEGLFPTTVDPGPDFNVADLLFDEGFFYCQVEPRAILARKCGPGEPTDSGCHYTVTSFRLTAHAAIACNGNVVTGPIPTEARGNYTNAQSRMRRDADSSPLLLHPLQKLEHPRKIFNDNEDPATVIRLWSKQVTTQ